MNSHYYYKKKKSKPVVEDFRAPSAGGVPTEARQAIINKVMTARPMKEAFAPAKTSSNMGLRMQGSLLSRGVNLPKNQMLEVPNFDFNEIDRVVQLEPMVMRAFYTIVSLVMNNNGFRFESENSRAKTWVIKRLDELTFAVNGTGSIPGFLRELVENIVKKSNAIIWLRRFRNGKKYNFAGVKTTPRAIEIIDPSLINLIRNVKSQRIEGYNLSTESVNRRIPRGDTHLIRYQRVTKDHWFGCPMILPVLNDILALRHMEEMVHMALGKATFPIYHIAIGDEKGEVRPQIHGNRGNDNEINAAKAEWESMAPEGAIFTPGYYRVTVVQPKNVADFEPYLRWYRERIIMGLMTDGPTMGLGETANRDTSNTMTQNLINKVKDIQCHIADQINSGLIRELLVEGGFKPLGADSVYLVWDEVDLEAMMNKNNHVMALFQSSLLTFDEARMKMGLDPMAAGDLDTKTYQPHLAKFQALVKAAGVQAATANRNQPANQTGKRKAAASRTTRRDSDMTYNRIKTLALSLGEDAASDPRMGAYFMQLREAMIRDLSRDMPTIPKKYLRRYIEDKVGAFRSDIIKHIKEGDISINTLFDVSRAKLDGILSATEKEFADDSS